MPNGDYIDGTFTGQWGNGIRINGTFHKLEATGKVSNSPRSLLALFCVTREVSCGGPHASQNMHLGPVVQNPD